MKRSPRVGLEQLPQAVAEFAPIIFADGLVADAVEHLSEPRLERGAALRRIEAAAFGFAHPQHLRQRARRGQHLGHRLPAARPNEIVWILAVGEHCELEALAGHELRQRKIDSAISGAPPRSVAVEAQDRLVCHLPQEHQLVGGERGTERRHRGLEAHAHQRDDIHIAFDRDDLAGMVRRGLAGVVRGGTRIGDVVECAAFVKERRLGRVEVFGLRVLFERAAPEGDRAPAQIGDREHDAVAEAVVWHRDVVARDQEPRLDHVLDRDALLAEVLLEREALGRRVAEPKLELRRRIEPAVGEIAARLGAAARGERGLKELRRKLDHLMERAPVLLARLVLLRDLGQRHAGLGGKPFDRFRKRDALGHHHEVEDRAVLARREIKPRHLLVIDEE